MYLFVFIVYCVGMLFIGLWAKGQTSTLEDYFVAKRDLGALVTATAYYSTAQSSGAFLGMVGWAYTFGWASNNYVSVPIIIGAIVAWVLLARKMRKVAGEINGLTVPDLLAWRFPGKTLRAVAAIIILLAYLPMMVAQIKGAGYLMQTLFNLDFTWACILGLAIVCLYVSLGGMRAVAYTDVFQALIMLVGIVVLAIASLKAVGGFTAMNTKVAAIDPGYIGAWGVGNSWGPTLALSNALLFLLSPMGQPIYIIKFFVMKDPDVARKALPMTYTMLIIASFCFPIVGLSARILLPDLAAADTALTVMAKTIVHPFFGAVILTCLFAAMMSTVDSLLLTVTSAVVCDIYQGVLGKNPGQKQLYQFSIATTVVIAVIGLVLALNSPAAIMALSSQSVALAGASFIVPVVGSLYSKRMTTQGAIAAMICGFGVTLLAWPGFIFETNLLGLHAFFWGFLAALIAATIVSTITGKGHSREATA